MPRYTLALLVLLTASAAVQADTVKIPRSVIEAGFKEAECTIDTKEIDDEQEAEPLGGKFALVEVYCWRAAYQAGSIFFIVDPAAPEKAQLVRFRTWATDKKRLDWAYSLTSANYSAETKTLSMAHKGRGVGDCGETATWKWNGKDFQLAGYWSKPNCDGKPFDEGRRWRVYPPRKKR